VITFTSASVFRAIIPSRVLLPTPAAANNPIRCPSPQVSSESMARTPIEIGFVTRLRCIGSGGFP
jgi:hypothetical protein